MKTSDTRILRETEILTAKDEFSTGWPIVLGATIGVGVGIIALPSPAIGIFMKALQVQFGWTRTEISLGPSVLIATLALVSPAVGRLVDRLSPVWITAVSLGALALCLFQFSRIGPSIWLYYTAFAVTAVLASGTATLVYARAISAHFSRGRGLALGLAMIGNGITGIMLLILLVPYAAAEGWRKGFVALAILVAAAALLVAFLMSVSGPMQVNTTKQIFQPKPISGAGLNEALRDPVFWTMAVCFALVPLGAGGMSLHFLAFMADKGVSPRTAGLLSSLSGVAMIVGRVATGWLIDRFPAPYVASAMMAISGASIAAVVTFGAIVAGLGAVAIGLSIGAELDLIGYLTASYFGMRAFGRIYGLLYAAMLVDGACSPVAYGAIFDLTRSYTAAFYMSAGLLLGASMLLLSLRPLPPLNGRAASSDSAFI